MDWVHWLTDSVSDPPTKPSRIAADEKQTVVDGEKKRLYAAINTETKTLLEIDIFSRCGIDLVSAFLH